MSSANTFEPPQKKARRTFPLPTGTKTSYSEAVLSSREFDLNKRSEAFSEKKVSHQRDELATVCTT